MLRNFLSSLRLPKLLTFLVSLLGFQLGQAQNYAVKFSADSAFVGRFTEDQFPVVHRYEFEVIGQSGLTIKDVESDCACVVSKFTKEKLAPGEKGVISVIYEPYRPGPFEKVFKVKFVETGSTLDLKLTGYIEPSLPQPELAFPHQFGNLRFKNKKIPLGTITNQGVVKKQIQVFNESGQPISILDSMLAPEYIQLVFDSSKVVPAKGTYAFDLFFDPGLKDEFGFLEENLTLFTDDPSSPRVDLAVSASVKQYFPPRGTGEGAEIPQLVVERDVVSLGSINMSSSRIVSFTILNSGKSELVIQKIVPNYGCEVVSMESYKIPPYSSSNLNVRIHNIGKSGHQDRTLTIFCNDPENTTKKLKVKFNLRD